MKNNFFNPDNNRAFMLRLENLTENATPKWGIMTPVQMLKHLQLENDLALGKYRGKDHSNFFREWAFKLVISGKMVLPMIFRKMRMVPAIPELDVVKSKIPVGSFEEEKQTLKQQFEELRQTEKLAILHPAIGKMNKEEWGWFYDWHTDYHFQQFGV